MDDDPAEPPSGSEPSLRNGSENEDGGGAADGGVRGEDSARELALRANVGVRGSRAGHVPGHPSVD